MRITRGKTAALLAAAMVAGPALPAGAAQGAADAQVAAQGAADAQVAQAMEQVDFVIPPQALETAVVAFGRQSGWQISVDQAALAGKSSPGVTGRMAPVNGLAQLLTGTGVAWRVTDPGTVLLEAVEVQGSIVLDPLVIADTRPTATTEGSGSYTTPATASATGLTMSLRETPQSVTVMTRARIEDQNLDEISKVIDQTVGVASNNTSALGTDGVHYYSRGFEVKNFQVNGASRPTTVYGFELSTSDMAIYDRVEVVRGATGLLNGVGNPSASINLVRKTPTDTPQGYVLGQVGSWNHGRVEADVGGPLLENGRLRGRLVAAKQDNETFTDREHQEKHALYGVIEADITESTTASFGIEHQSFENSGASRGGIPPFFTDGGETNLSRSSNFSADWSLYERQWTTYLASLAHRFDNGWNADLNVEYSVGEYDDTIGYMWGGAIDRAGAGASFLAGRWAADLDQLTIETRANGPFTLFDREHELMVGASYSRSTDEGPDYPLWWSGPEYYYALPNAFDLAATGQALKPDLNPLDSRFGGDVVQTSAYAATRLKPLESVSIILGGRLTNFKEREWTQMGGADKVRVTKSEETGVFTPYAGVVVDLTDTISVYASYTDIFDPQSNEDISGSTLAPLEGAAYEAGVKGEFYGGRLNASAAVFQVEQSNFAVAIPGVLNPNGKQAYRSEDGTTSQGFELELSGEILPDWQVGGGYTRTIVEDKDGNGLLTDIPENMLKLFTTYRLPGEWRDVVVGGNLRWQGDVYQDVLGGSWPNNDKLTQDSVTILDLMARYELDPVTLSLNVNNVFDQKYYSGVTTMVRYGQPRSVMLTAKYKF